MDTTKKENETQLQPQLQPHPRFLKSYIEDNVFEAFNFCQFFLFERISLLIKDN